MPSKSRSAESEAARPGGRLVLVGTPIGNREDLAPRALRALVEASLLLCEDTRSPLRLVAGLDDAKLPRRVSCFLGNEQQRTELMLEELRAGRTVAFVSEAGMPAWSDPGRILVEAALAGGFAVDVVPGPTAMATAVALSGFDATWAQFVGFPPRGGVARREVLERVARHHGATIFYEAGNRVRRLLADLAAVLDDAGTRRVLVARELTKLHQDLIRGALAGVAATCDETLRGEVSIVVEGPAPTTVETAPVDSAQATAREVFDLMLDPDCKPRARARRLAELTGADAREIYARLVRER